MGKTFEEWYLSEELEEYLEESLENRFFRSHLCIKELLEEAWIASRENMTWKDV